jgi:hypothetical protein
MNEEYAYNALGSFVEPDTLISHDYARTQSRTLPAEPEQILMFAVLKDALETFQRLYEANTRAGRRLFREAEEWIWSDEADRVFAFVHVCDMLGLDPGYLRRGLHKWAAAHKSEAYRERQPAAVSAAGLSVVRASPQQRREGSTPAGSRPVEQRAKPLAAASRLRAGRQSSSKSFQQRRRAISKLHYTKQA